MEEPRRAGEARDDDLALMAELQPDALPTAAAVERDRTRLRHAIQASSGLGDLGEVHETMNQNRDDESGNPEAGKRKPTVISLTASEPKQQRARRRPILAAAAAALVVVVGGILVVASDAGDGEETSDVAGSGESAGPADEGASGAQGSPSDASYTCGAELPVDLPVPDGYTGPVDGLGPDSVNQPADGQLVVHWESDHGSIEVRWPALSEPALVESMETAEASAAEATFSDEPGATDRGRAEYLIDVIGDEDFGEGECANVSIAVADDDPAQLSQASSTLYDGLFPEDEEPLVSGSAVIASPPEVVPCDTVGGGQAPYLRGEVEGLGSFQTPEAAGEAFLERHQTTVEDAFGEGVEYNPPPEGGYSETPLPDDSVLYVNETEGGVAVAMGVVQTDDGWTVTNWQVSGC